MRDDLDYEEQTRGKKSKDGLVKAIIKSGFAPLVLADSMKNSALSRDHKLKDVWNKSMKNYPDSVFDESVEGIDVVTSHGPQFAAENPNTAAALGVLLDFADPMSYGLTKVASKAGVPATLAQGTMKIGDNIADKGTEAWVKKVTKKKDMKSVPRLVDYIKKNKLRGELRHPDKLIETLDGKYGVDETKIAEGTLDKVGQKIKESTRNADRKGAQQINRGEIYRKMKRAVEAQNADDTVSGVIKKDPYLGKLSEVIKPFKRERTIIEGEAPAKPSLTPSVPEEGVEETIARLSKEADTIKKKKVQPLPDEPKVDKESVKAAQLRERKAAESKVSKNNAEVEADNEQVNKELLSLLLKKRVATDKVDPLDVLPVPKAQKGLPPIPAKEVLDIQAHNKKAAVQNKKYLEQQELQTQLPSIEEQIEMLRTLPKKQLDEVDVPPPMPDDAFPLDVPPVIPASAKGRDLESVLAELSDAQAAKANLAKTNTKIKGENTDALKNFGLESKANAPKVKDTLVDRVSNLEDMWKLKVDARKKLRKAVWDTKITNLDEHKKMVVEATQEIDNKIIESLKDINFAEGNAADIYRALNDEFGTQSDFLELVVDDTLAKWKGGKSKGGALPALTGGVAAAIAAKTGGGNVPLSTVMGATAGEAARRGFGLSPEMKASIGDRLSRPEAAHVGTQAGVEILEIPSEYGRQGSDREVENQAVAPGEAMSVSEEDMSPELRNLIQGDDRKPQSVEEAPAPEGDPIDQKMTHVLMPEKPQWDPYINEEVLNTFLPRDSKRILANPTALMAKMQQVAPNQVPVLQEMLDNDPDSLVEAAPKLAVMFPALFEKDKYGMFDGKIVDPMMQQKFLMDLSEDEEMDAIEKANIAMKVQRGESIHS